MCDIGRRAIRVGASRRKRQWGHARVGWGLSHRSIGGLGSGACSLCLYLCSVPASTYLAACLPTYLYLPAHCVYLLLRLLLRRPRYGVCRACVRDSAAPRLCCTGGPVRGPRTHETPSQTQSQPSSVPALRAWHYWYKIYTVRTQACVWPASRQRHLPPLRTTPRFSRTHALGLAWPLTPNFASHRAHYGAPLREPSPLLHRKHLATAGHVRCAFHSRPSRSVLCSAGV